LVPWFPNARGFSLLLLAIFLPPLALYLIVLGWINRRSRPIMMAGAWDFAGVLFALSGFLLFGGPAFLSSLDEQSRTFWLLGVAGPAKASPTGNWTFWIVIRLFYFAVVGGGAAFVLWRGRRLTSVYNVDSRWIITALEQAYQRLGLNPLRYGDSFLIETKPDPAALPGADPETALPNQSTLLRVDVFPPMRHATLRWEPADWPLRREVEKQLARLLAEAPPSEEESILGGCLTLLGVSLFVFTGLGACFLILLHFFTVR
jgi:hypothetical protein